MTIVMISPLDCINMADYNIFLKVSKIKILDSSASLLLIIFEGEWIKENDAFS